MSEGPDLDALGGLGEMSWGMDSEEGDAAVTALYERVLGLVGPQPDMVMITDTLNEGFALIATMHAEVMRPVVVEGIMDSVVAAIAANVEDPDAL
jgi:uncharacterized protein (DUF1786 family)